jgi:hypothetical protein
LFFQNLDSDRTAACFLSIHRASLLRDLPAESLQHLGDRQPNERRSVERPRQRSGTNMPFYSKNIDFYILDRIKIMILQIKMFQKHTRCFVLVKVVVAFHSTAAEEMKMN